MFFTLLFPHQHLPFLNNTESYKLQEFTDAIIAIKPITVNPVMLL